jgi:hypothetical protein
MNQNCIKGCGKRAEFYCDCNLSLVLLCSSCISKHKREEGNHNIKPYSSTSPSAFLSGLILQLKHSESEIIRLTQQRLQEINNQCTNSLHFIAQKKKELIETNNNFKGIPKEYVDNLITDLSDEMWRFYSELYKYTIEITRKIDMPYVYEKGCYNGELQNNLPNGVGVMAFKNGDSYEGEFVNGLMHGLGVLYKENGDIYKGEWRNDVKKGKGEYICFEKWIYTGEWANDRFHGYGRIEFLGDRRGESYDGQWENGLKHGQGIEYVGSERFEGEFEKGLRDGMIIHFFENGENGNEIWAKGELQHIE